jgi:hypothetical protein
LAISFGLDDSPWNEELILQRYELLYEAGLVEEAIRIGMGKKPALIPGRPMIFDHRRILATGIARLRAKIKYRPVVFELMPPVLFAPERRSPSQWPGTARSLVRRIA